MNFLCHARHQEDPWCVIGTLLPDFLSIFRASRLRPSKMASVNDATSDVQRALRTGVALHFTEDAWFHTLPAFDMLTHDFTLQLRTAEQEAVLLPRQRPFRAHFFAHILLEMLLDASWEQTHPGATAKLYTQLTSLPFAKVEQEIHAFLLRSEVKVMPPVAIFLQRFVQSRFLFDYDDDDKVLFRLTQVGERVRQAPLLPALLPVIYAARPVVHAHQKALLTAPPRK